MNSIGRLVILVNNYEEAIAFYRDKLGFEVFIDSEAAPHRFVHIRLPSQKDMGIWLLQATSDTQQKKVGAQTAGQPCAVIYTDNFEKEYKNLVNNGVYFSKPPVSDGGAKFAHFEDLYGNEFILVELQAESVE
ncbi:glyoxalase [Microbulbifer sp. A4B17]|uniref:VOC family protein n=1 Tax=Microbulbifer sp. A4B17 TaxID=359370 RepID=UPI000D52B013|nr:VOC family protein [Microbulbifer sp. A4B17]AWF82066.1 glyoxalase [Microbulbifer sp. A4B17]